METSTVDTIDNPTDTTGNPQSMGGCEQSVTLFINFFRSLKRKNFTSLIIFIFDRFAFFVTEAIATDTSLTGICRSNN